MSEYDWAKATLGGLGPAIQNTLVPMPWVPTPPSGTTAIEVQAAHERFDKRWRRLQELLPITAGRVIPDDDDLMIGDATRLEMSVLFLDICGFTKMDSELAPDQERVLKLLNLFMAEMLEVVYRHDGHFEKNTGDGLMAYFKESTLADSVRQAVDAAVTMHNHNDLVISPRLREVGLPEVKFRVGIEVGPVTIANVGIRGGSGTHRSHVAIGNAANVACKAMLLLPHGGIVLGNRAKECMRPEWQNQTVPLLTPVPGYFFRSNPSVPYTAWELTYRAPSPAPYYGALEALGGLTALVGR